MSLAYIYLSFILIIVSTLADPDRSNPTRPRFERPLDTIRSFEAAIRGTYTVEPSPPSRRPSYIRGRFLFSTCFVESQLTKSSVDDASQIFDYRGHKDSYYGGNLISFHSDF